jgi:hypothetical protein
MIEKGPWILLEGSMYCQIFSDSLTADCSAVFAPESMLVAKIPDETPDGPCEALRVVPSNFTVCAPMLGLSDLLV